MMTRARDIIRTRIAPSPTGFAHVGTAYTALFNYAFAKRNGGKFVIRIEDTDRKRHVPEAEKAIFKGLSWLGLSWDESVDKGGQYEPYRQSDRLEIYKKKAKELVDAGQAYEDEGAIRFKNPGVDISWDDLVHGKITFPGGEVTDFVILKADGFPTYNFAVVIDDYLMKITHVIRGEEHISNTPRQIALYKAFGWDHPQFAHHPTLRNKEKKKLSKRRDSVDLRVYQRDGYLPEALVNFLCLLGWSHPDEKEIFTLEEFVEKFSLERVRKAGPIFDVNKLDWINGEYIRNLPEAELAEKIFDYFEGKYDQKRISEVLPLVSTRIKILKEFGMLAGFFFEAKKIDKSYFGKGYKNHIKNAALELSKISNWNKGEVDKTLLGLIDKSGFKTGDFFMDLRVAITGSRFTPPINDSLVILGKDETLTRLRKALEK